MRLRTSHTVGTDDGWHLSTSLVSSHHEVRPYLSSFQSRFDLVFSVWKIIQPKLEALIEEEKAKKLERARKNRIIDRASEFKPFWDSLIPDIINAYENVIPTFSDAQELPAIAELLAEDNAHTPVTEKRFLARKDAILADIPGYQTRVKRELVKYGVPSLTAPTTQIADEDLDLSILNHASTLFRCPGSWTCKMLLPYPDIFSHEHIALGVVGTFVSSSLSRLRPTNKVKPMAIQVLKALGLPEDTPASVVSELNGRFICRCGHPNHREPMDFGALVSSLMLF